MFYAYLTVFGLVCGGLGYLLRVYHDRRRYSRALGDGSHEEHMALYAEYSEQPHLESTEVSS